MLSWKRVAYSHPNTNDCDRVKKRLIIYKRTKRTKSYTSGFIWWCPNRRCTKIANTQTLKINGFVQKLENVRKVTNKFVFFSHSDFTVRRFQLYLRKLESSNGCMVLWKAFFSNRSFGSFFKINSRFCNCTLKLSTSFQQLRLPEDSPE